ncbi:MAG: alpha/beta hydrolase [Bacteroidota bacterium]|nr:alpha/beta hydrolase [Bacteroidota bacterium]
MHGWQSHSFYWKNYVKAISKEEFTIYAIDAPGHGHSSGNFLNVPFYGEVIYNLLNKIGNVDTVISHSIGSFSLMYLLSYKTLPINKMVVMAPPSKAMDFINFYKDILKLSDRTVNLTLRHFEKEINKPIEFFSTKNFALNLNTPALIIHDKNDPEAPYEGAVDIHTLWKQSQLVTTEGLNHTLKSQRVVELVVRYIQENSLVVKESINI